MTQNEARDVIALFQQRRPQGVPEPSITDLAEALQVPPEQVEALLHEVRSKSTNAQSLPKDLRKAKRREKRVWLASGLAAIVFAILLVPQVEEHLGTRLLFVPSFLPHSKYYPAYDKPLTIVVDLQTEARPVKTASLVQQIQRAIEQLPPSPRIHYDRPAEDLISQLHRGEFLDPQIQMRDIRVRDGLNMVVANGQIPFYNGDEMSVEKLVEEIRNARIRDLAIHAKSLIDEPAPSTAP